MISSIPMDYVLFAFKGYEQGERAEHLVQAGKRIFLKYNSQIKLIKT
ncbi:unnamed protein product [Schistosoma curassoni]|uniref:Transposase n=1 Tax=Schistosoma curassoni TaxID=6186 RepID=A0A183JJJ1_9TREM|nr:unnamed protein product [Schistosoma curassoni]